MNPTIKQLFVFGYGLSIILTFISYRLFVKHGWGLVNWILIALAIVFLFLTIVNYQWLKQVYTRWIFVAQGIGHVMTSIIMVVLFFLVFSPVGILLRIFKKDFLNRSPNANFFSYWNIRQKEKQDIQRYTQQF